MKTNDFYKKFLADVDLKEKDVLGAIKTVTHLHDNPDVMGIQSPPPGYEEHLLASLSRRLPDPKPAQKKPTKSSWSWISFAQGWGLSFGVAAAAFVAFVVYSNKDFQSGSDLEANAYVELVGADADNAESWLATVSDAGFRLENAGNDIQGMAMKISKDEKLLKRLNASLSGWEP